MNASLKRGRTILAPLARRYAELTREAEVTLAALTDEELQSVEAAANWYGTSNCGWDEFGLAKGKESILGKALARERHVRGKRPRLTGV